MDRAVYEEHAQLESDHWWFVGRRDILESVLTRYLPTSGADRILDVGCGTGGMLPMLAQFGTVEGMEGEPLAVEHCQATYRGFDVRVGQIPADVPADGTFDLVTAFDVIEHLDDDVGALRALRSAVRPGGTVAVTVPALQWLWSDHDTVNGHRRRYTRRRLREALDAADLDVVHVSYFNMVLLPIVATARLAQRVRGPVVAPSSDFSMPSPRLNRLLTGVLRWERSMVAARGLPVGVSLVAVARRSTTLLADGRGGRGS
ncbi:MAG: class I SAM-dependent methyltransferase [Acidimicrobiales bacterium]